MQQDQNYLIPINTRTMGNPNGIYVLYLEDYVHTFLKKLLARNQQKFQNYTMGNCDYTNNSLSDKWNGTKEKVIFYGNYIQEQGKYIFVVSGAASFDYKSESNNHFFENVNRIGQALVSYNKDKGIKIEMSLDSVLGKEIHTFGDINFVIEDYYIYYAQNENMQNYLIDWNTQKGILAPSMEISQENLPQRKANIEDSDVVRYGRMIQAYKREEVKLGVVGSAINILSLSLVIFIMVYGIISFNNYSKMKEMQTSIEYCMNYISEQMVNNQYSLPVALNLEDIDTENESEGEDETVEVKSTVMETAVSEESILNSEISYKAQASNDKNTDNVQSENSNEIIEAVDNNNSQIDESDKIPQYYVVQKGDTLQSICIDVYGDDSRVWEVCEWNNIQNPNSILCGQKLLLP